MSVAAEPWRPTGPVATEASAFEAALTSPADGSTIPLSQALPVTWPSQPLADYALVELFSQGASAFTGVEFTLTGSVAGCSIQYSTNDVQHDDMSTDPKGSCTLGSACYSPQAAITTVPTTATPVKEPFITTAGGNPSAPTNPSMLTGIQWQFTIAPAAEGGAPVSCVSDLKITDVQFYH